MIEVGKVTAQSCLWGLACPAGDDSVPSQGSPLRCLCSSDLPSLSHTVWTAGRPINEDRASNGAAPWASVGCFQSSLLDQCGSRWLYCVLTMAPLQGLCSVLLSSWGGHRQPCSTGSRLRGGPCWHLIQVGGGGGVVSGRALHAGFPPTLKSPPTRCHPLDGQRGCFFLTCEHPGCAVLIC